MIERLQQSLQAQSEALALRAWRQQVIASNIANADTPGYRAVDFDFAAALERALRAQGQARLPRLVETPAAQPAADGNTVDLDTERAKFADNALRYEVALRALNGQIRTLLDAIRG
jgi:flagellar basal-body rod protein FlgB